MSAPLLRIRCRQPLERSQKGWKHVFSGLFWIKSSFSLKSVEKQIGVHHYRTIQSMVLSKYEQMNVGVV